MRVVSVSFYPVWKHHIQNSAIFPCFQKSNGERFRNGAAYEGEGHLCCCPVVGCAPRPSTLAVVSKTLTLRLTHMEVEEFIKESIQ